MIRLPSLLRRRPSVRLAAAVSVHPVTQPIALVDRDPGPVDRSPSGWAWWGHWESGRWVWMWDDSPWEHHTHWLPAWVEVLPVRCCMPKEVG